MHGLTPPLTQHNLNDVTDFDPFPPAGNVKVRDLAFVCIGSEHKGYANSLGEQGIAVDVDEPDIWLRNRVVLTVIFPGVVVRVNRTDDALLID